MVPAGTTACWSGRVSTMAPTIAAAAARTAGADDPEAARRAAWPSSSTSPMVARAASAAAAEGAESRRRAPASRNRRSRSFMTRPPSGRRQLAGERRPSSREVGLDGALRAAQHGGDVGQRAVFHVEQGDRPALLLGKPADEPPQLGIGVGRHVDGGGRLADAVQRSRLPPRRRRTFDEALRATRRTHAPGRSRRADPRPVPLGLGQRLLGEVLGPLPVAREGVEHRDEARVLVTEEALERHRPVTCCDHHLPSHTAPAWRVDSECIFRCRRSRPLH